jgi:hypothetical protein
MAMVSMQVTVIVSMERRNTGLLHEMMLKTNERAM